MLVSQRDRGQAASAPHDPGSDLRAGGRLSGDRF